MAGVFFNWCANHCVEERVTLHVDYIDNILDYIGTQNRAKRITIKGDVGDRVGQFMDGGKLLIYGNVGDELGSHMEGGKIHVYGNAGHRVGYNMFDGKIMIHGNAGHDVGYEMHGGEIRILGGYKSIAKGYDEDNVSYATEGDIYYRGKLIFEHGRKLE